MNLKDHILLWNHAYIDIIDIRRSSFSGGAADIRYKLPASAYLYVIHGSGKLLVDEIIHEFRSASIVHGGKGTVIEILRTEEALEYYLILYKSILALPARNNLLALMERCDSFNQQYIFVPGNPLPLFDRLSTMFREWQKGGELEHLQVKALFYQWVHELLWQLHARNIEPLRPDPLEHALRYMQEHYNEPITLEKLAEAVGSSPRTLTRLYRIRLQTSPAQYLIRIRMERALELLLHTEASLYDIAVAVGYPDGYYFGRMFKKYYGASPVKYKNSLRNAERWPEMPSAVARYDIAAEDLLRYIDYDNHYQYKTEGASFMFRNAKPSLLLTLMLCFTILLSACSSGTANTSASTTNAPAVSPSASASAAAAPESPAADAQTRTISTVKGDIEVPANPQRVVVLYLLGDVLALDVKPVGVSDVSEGAAFEEELKDVQKLGSWFEASPEVILSLDPDLIIVPSEETYQALHEIAPTVLVPYEKMTAEERVSFIGQVLGKEGQATALFDAFHAKVEESKQKLQEAGILDRTISIMEGGKDRSMSVVASKQFGRGSQVIYEYLGMKAPGIIQQKIDTATGADGESVSFEVLAQYSGDYIFRSSYEGMADLTRDPIWNSIPAVKEGRLLEIDFGLAYYSDIYSLNAQLDYIVQSLLAAPRVN
ncbi:AraC family transcriptional regulator [Paenibacillus sp. S150]|uniref:AraC family transcriptional regulator n=1 Tax=Paenibacillus sp. S150 TaxID=2749826 RepID=UPI001C57173E|nr:AraC family transcriptional regulator [Paenibacillus sp. S150]MBW4081912.1 AraC family transcriptional regulator [Paenibacillus sp. S150]